jgi:polyhydroxybutyrate depolymerase
MNDNQFFIALACDHSANAKLFAKSTMRYKRVGPSPRNEASTSFRTPVIGLLSALCALVSSLPASTLRAAEILTFAHQNVLRTAVLHRPVSTLGREAPLVIALHGSGGTGEGIRMHVRLDAVADREKFVAVYPDAIGSLWSYGRPINQPMPTVAGATVDDVGYIRRLIHDLVDRKIADPSRIYVIGLSRGGLMAYTLACELADRIAAAAPLIAGMTEHQRDDCKPARPVPVLVLAGTSDTEMAFKGAPGLQGRLLSVADTMEFWRSRHGCVRSDTQRLPHRDPRDATQLTVLEWSGCRSNAKLRLYQVEGGGHQIPTLASAAGPMSQERFGPRNRDIETAEEVWAFFRGYVVP